MQPSRSMIRMGRVLVWASLAILLGVTPRLSAADRDAVLQMLSAGEQRPQTDQTMLREDGNDPQVRPAILSGQNIGHANDRFGPDHRRFFDAVYERTGEYPAILSVDYGYNEIPDDLRDVNQQLIEHWRKGGLVMVSMHPANPWTGGDCHDLDVGNFEDLFQEGTPANKVWMQQLERVAHGLGQLKQAGVVVLWRPFHEMNGGWFWWCGRERNDWMPAERFQQLWTQTHDYLSRHHQLDNLLWVYSPAAQTSSSQRSTTHYYPGADRVDLLAMDWYTDDPRWIDVQASYQQLASLRKPIGLAEFGPLDQRHGQFDNRRLIHFLETSPVPWAFFCYWHSWEGADVAMVDHLNLPALMHDPMVINRDELGGHWREAEPDHSSPLRK